MPVRAGADEDEGWCRKNGEFKFKGSRTYYSQIAEICVYKLVLLSGP